MKIAQVEVIVAFFARTPGGAPNCPVVKITTDQPGLIGWGNGALSGGELAVKTLIDEARLRGKAYAPSFFPEIGREDGATQDP